MRIRRNVRLGLLLAALALCGGGALFWHRYGAYGVNVVLRNGGIFWLTVGPASPRLSPAMRLALSTTPPEAVAGDLSWHQAAPGFETAALPVLADGKEVDRIVLARIDPARYRFTVRTAPDGRRDIDDWMRSLGAVLVVNGSYSGPTGQPATPVISDGSFQGPVDYDAHHGAFVVAGGMPGVVNLSHQTWHAAYRDAQEGMVSFPLLVGRESGNPPIPRSRWLASRSFVGQDETGRVIVGTTQDGFFSLDRLASFLRAAPLDLVTALNLDGGPVACLGIDAGDTHIRQRGRWEMREKDGRGSLLTWPFGTISMPVVLAVLAK